jgi:hypothetical protein
MLKLLWVVTASVSLSVQRVFVIHAAIHCAGGHRRTQYHLDGDDAEITAAHVFLDALENPLSASKLGYPYRRHGKAYCTGRVCFAWWRTQQTIWGSADRVLRNSKV